MTESPKLHSLTCPNCSAPLEYDGTSPTVTCRFCGAQAAVPDELRAEAAARPPTSDQDDEVMQQINNLVRNGEKIAAIQLYRITFGAPLAEAKQAIDAMEARLNLSPEEAAAAAAKATAAGRKIGLWVILVTLGILIFAGGMVALALTQPGGPLSSGLALSPALLVPGEAGKLPGVAFSSYNVNSEQRAVSFFDPNTKKTLWTSAPLGGDGFVDALGAQGELVYAASGSDLLAWKAADGSLAWQTKLTDSAWSQQTLLVLGGRVIVLTRDSQLSAFDAQTGKPAWSRTLRGSDRRLLAAGDYLLLPDYTGSSYDFSIFLLNPTDGKVVQELVPVCVKPGQEQYSERFESSSGLTVDPQGKAVYLMFGSFFGCVQRFSLTDGKKTLEITRDERFELSFYGFNTLWAGSDLYFNSGHQLLKLDTAAGSLTTLLDEDNRYFVPLAVSGGNLILRATKTIGSSTSELWGLSAAGEKKWQHAFAEGEPLDPPNGKVGLIDKGDPGWSWQVVDGSLKILMFEAEPNQLVIETLAPQDGVSQGKITIPLRKVSGDFYSTPELLSRQGTLAWYLVDTNIIVFDLQAGKILVQR